jgi:thiol-disulfide isomerase/thioredoxin
VRSIIFSITFLTACLFAHAQVNIDGRAPGYKNQEIELVTASDYISGKGQVVARTRVDENGNFRFKSMIEYTARFKLVCNNTEAILYTEPGANYNVEFPLPDDKSKDNPVKFVSLLFDTLPVYDINNLILDFNSRADDFIYYNFNIIGNDLFAKRLDTFKIYLSKVYDQIKNHAYFSDYVAYSVAEMEMLGPPKKDQPVHELYVYMEYLNSKPVRYTHDKYMDFFNKFYEGVLKELNPVLEPKVISAINFYASPTLLDRILQRDPLLGNKRIRELVIIKSLKEEFYNQQFLSDQVLVMLDSLSRFSTYDEHQIIASNVIEQYTWLHAGFSAPDFLLKDHLDSTWKLSEMTGKHVYIGFWSVENTHSVNELQLLIQMHKKYKDYVSFVMINTDKDVNAWKNFLKKHPDYRWLNLNIVNGSDVIRDYKVTALPLYYLIDSKGKIMQSPALAPSPNGSFKSIDMVFHGIAQGFKKRNRTRVGEHDDK